MSFAVKDRDLMDVDVELPSSRVVVHLLMSGPLIGRSANRLSALPAWRTHVSRDHAPPLVVCFLPVAVAGSPSALDPARADSPWTHHDAFPPGVAARLVSWDLGGAS